MKRKFGCFGRRFKFHPKRLQGHSGAPLYVIFLSGGTDSLSVLFRSKNDRISHQGGSRIPSIASVRGEATGFESSDAGNCNHDWVVVSNIF